MQNWKPILLTILAVMLLAAFAFLTPEPAISAEAYDVYQGLTDD